jgi:hypothetical protein
MVTNSPSTSSQCNLKQGVAIEEDDNGDQEAEGEGAVSCGFVWFVERVGLGKFLLVVFELLLLLARQDAVFLFFWVGDGAGLYGGEVAAIMELGERLFAAETPCQVVVVSNEAHLKTLGRVILSEGNEMVEGMNIKYRQSIHT